MYFCCTLYCYPLDFWTSRVLTADGRILISLFWNILGNRRIRIFTNRFSSRHCFKIVWSNCLQNHHLSEEFDIVGSPYDYYEPYIWTVIIHHPGGKWLLMMLTIVSQFFVIDFGTTSRLYKPVNFPAAEGAKFSHLVWTENLSVSEYLLELEIQNNKCD